MKKRICMVMCLMILSAVIGCEAKDTSAETIQTGSEKTEVSSVNPGKKTNQTKSVEDILAEGMAAEDQKKEQGSSLPSEDNESDPSGIASEAALEQEADPNVNAGDTVNRDDMNQESIDVDLTALSSTMVYSEVYNMMVFPENYVGKTVKMNGTFYVFHDETTGNYYFSCIISDATACCSQGIEFVLEDSYVYPRDYPKEGEEICVMGVFDTYQEGDYTYCTLRNARTVG